MLPSHFKNTRNSAANPGLQSAFTKGLGYAGIQSTKGGSGEKERAYIVRQYWVLKMAIFFILFLTIGFILLFSTVLKVSITRRDAIKSEALHHKLEHQAQLKLVRAHLELQYALAQEVHETNRIEEFIVNADIMIGDHVNEIQKLLKDANVEPVIIDTVEKHDETLRSHLESGLKEIVKHFKKSSEKARLNLKKVATSISSNIEIGDVEDKRYRKKMLSDFGVDISDDFSHDISKELFDEYQAFNFSDGKTEDVDDEREVQNRLDRFFEKLNQHDFPSLNVEIINEWEKDMSELTNTLSKSDQDIDIAGLERKVNGKIAMYAPKVQPFDHQKHSSIVDYYEMRIEEAKLASHKQELLDLYKGYKFDGSISPYVVISNLEQIAEENNLYLVFDWFNGDEADEDVYQETKK